MANRPHRANRDPIDYQLFDSIDTVKKTNDQNHIRILHTHKTSLWLIRRFGVREGKKGGGITKTHKDSQWITRNHKALHGLQAASAPAQTKTPGQCVRAVASQS